MAVTYAIGELSELAGVSRRTVRYYVQEGLLPAPLGLGRGNHYGEEHLDRLLRVKAMQEAGQSLDEIRNVLTPDPAAPRAAPRIERARKASPERALWRRLTLAPGIELHVEAGRRLLSPGRLEELAAWCRAHINASSDEDHDA